MLVLLLDRAQCRLQVAHIVHRIEHAEHVHTVHRSALDKFFHHIIGVVPVTENILAAEQHLLRRIRHGFFQFADALPGIFPQVADTGIKGCPTPGLQ